MVLQLHECLLRCLSDKHTSPHQRKHPHIMVQVIIFLWTSESWAITYLYPLSMVIGREPDESLILAMENKKNECFSLYLMKPLSPQDDSGALVRAVPTQSHDSNRRASKLSVAGLLRHVRATAAEEPSNFPRAYVPS